MAENKQSLRRGRLPRMPALLILLFAAVLIRAFGREA